MTNSRKILIVDDDAELREALVEQLALHEEFESIAVDSGSKGVQAAKAGQIDLVIMDVGLPDVDGREAVRILRKNGFKAPIIMLTGYDTDSDTILGLESGANDYVAKPFRFAVLLARIRAQLRQHEASEDAVFTIGPHTFRPSSKLLVTLVVTAATLVATIWLYVIIPKGFLPLQDTGLINAVVEGGAQVSFAEMQRLQAEVVAAVRKDPDVTGTASVIGVSPLNATPNAGHLAITLKPR